MIPDTASGPALAILAGLALPGLVCGVALRRVLRSGLGEAPRPADAIVVFGAAVRADGPSLAVRVRVARAAAIYHEGWAPRIVCSGGVSGGLSEARVMCDLLRDLGVPDAALVGDDGGSSTRAALRSLARRGDDRPSCVLAVSSPYHLYRIGREARRHRIDAVLIAARRDRPATPAERAHDRRKVLREVAAVVGYAVLSAIDTLAATPPGRIVRRVVRGLAARASYLLRDADRTARASETIARLIKDGVAGSTDTGAVLTPASGLAPPIDGRIASRFGLRHRRLHAGVDFAAAYGTPVRAAAAGTVLRTGWIGPYGNVVVVHHGGGLATVYAHLSEIAVDATSTVDAGQRLGRVGETGRSFGAHLHFEVRVHGSAVDPSAFLPARPRTPA